MTWRSRLRQAVDESGQTHGAIARKAGIHPETLSRILTGAHGRPGFETIVSIAHAAGESVGWVLGEREYQLSRWDRERLREAASIITATVREERCARDSIGS